LAKANHGIPFITNIGRKGGSNVAAAVVNALAILAAAQK
jgi:precorrin-8X/cobalt-precorrin-8 methylmutase